MALLALAAACAGSAEQAQHDLAGINAAFGVIAGEAATLQPQEYADLTRQLGELQASFDRGEYRRVVAAVPQLHAQLAALQQRLLAARAAARAAQQAEWARFADQVPEQITALERRLDQLAAARPAHAPASDVAAAQQAVRATVALWSKGQSAYAAGNLAEALQVAHDVQARAAELAASLPSQGPAPSSRNP